MDEKSKKRGGGGGGGIFLNIESSIFLFLPSDSGNAIFDGKILPFPSLPSPSLNFHAIRHEEDLDRGGEGIIDGRTAESEDRVLSRSRAH